MNKKVAITLGVVYVIVQIAIIIGVVSWYSGVDRTPIEYYDKLNVTVHLQGSQNSSLEIEAAGVKYVDYDGINGETKNTIEFTINEEDLDGSYYSVYIKVNIISSGAASFEGATWDMKKDSLDIYIDEDLNITYIWKQLSEQESI